jgi:5,10-methylenetetrahydrofolate reductase
MIKNKGSLGEDIIQKILLYYENINPEWLLLSKGNMLKEDPVLTQMTDKHVSEMIYLIRELSEENGAIKAEKRRLKEEIKQLKEKIEHLSAVIQ